ncbi:membrane protein insertion efficiency factor YidD [Elusimicrobiota bacterium]
MSIAAIRVYQMITRPILPMSCRYSVSCSDYTILAINNFGLRTGAWEGLKRILTCHPFHKNNDAIRRNK